ncbi:MAG: DUF4493 domain-containing protein [Rikenellaceae bacterium]|nr:DUF4493 domain-containing protein [Rikenellaceae bacterium]
MKNFMKIACALLVAAFAMTACSSENTEFQRPQKPVVTADTGFLSFAEQGLSVITDAEVVRAAAVNTDDFICTILDEQGAEIERFTYGNKPTEPIELKVGSYKLVVVSEETIPAKEWEHPTYGAEVPFTISKGETNTLETIKCKLSNVKVTVAYAADLYNLLEAGSKSDVTVGSNMMSFAYTEERAAFFAAEQEENSMTVDMSLNYAGKNSTMSYTVNGVKAGQWRKITISMPHANEGNVVFTITIETLTVDNEIVVDVAELTAMSETVIPSDEKDPLAPIISWEGHDLDETFQLMASHFDQDGNCTVPVVFDVDANNSTFKSFVVNVESTSSSFMTSLESMNILTEFDICQVNSTTNSSLNTALTMVGIPTGAKVLGKESVSVALTNLMGILYEHQGTHTFTLTVTNEAGHTVQQPIVMLVNKASEGGSTGNAPTVEWVGYDISKAYTITSDLTVKIEVSAPAGIKAFTVDIDSDVLDAQALDGLLPVSGIDLINPEEWYAGFLGGLFPTGDQVLNQTFLSFDITEFMGMLDMLVAAEDKGYANFVLNVTDNNGQYTKATLQLLIHQ